MQKLFQFALLGLGTGAVYALLAQGLVLIYRASGVVNFAQGAMAMVGAFVYFELTETHGQPWGVGLFGSAAFCAVLGWLIYVLVMKRMRRAAPLARVIATLGLLIVLQSAAGIRYGDDLKLIDQPLPDKVVRILDVAIGRDRLWLLGVACTLTALLYAASRFSNFGRATSAVAENQVAAATLGWSPDFIASVNWAAGSALAAVAGALVSPLTGLNVTTLGLLVIPAMATALLGGFSSFPLTLAAGVGIGILQTEVAHYADGIVGLPQAMPLIAIVFVLVLRGRALPLRDHVLERLPEIGTGRVRVVPMAIVIASITALVLTVPNKWVDGFSITFIAALFMLSVVVLTGYAGQLSLAQYALGGCGALVAGRLVSEAGWPFEIALVAGIAAAMAVGLAFAVPAVRTRGVNLAVVTLSMSLAVQAMVFSSQDYTGGLFGLNIGAQTLFGVDIDPINSPVAYALFSLVALVLASLVVCNLRRSRAGLRLVAVRTNERAAASLGISVVGAKLYAFAISAGIAGLAGIILGFRNYSIVFTDYDTFRSVTIVALAVVGGVGYVIGPLFGSTLAAGSVGALIGSAIFGDGVDQWLALAGGMILLLLLIQNANGMASHNTNMVKTMISKWNPSAADEAAQLLPSVAPVRVQPSTLEVKSLTVRFGAVTAVDNVDLTVAPGTIVGLIGPNGAGKTTFIDAVTGFVKPSSGSVLIDGHPIDHLRAYQRARRGVTRSFQSLELFDDVSVRDNLQAASDPRDKLSYATGLLRPGRPELAPVAVAALRDFDLDEVLLRRPEQLSYGKRRLVGIARAVATSPSVLLLDEPAAGLGDAETAELGHLVRQLANEWSIGILLIEHDMSVVMAICDRIAVLDFGRKIAEGTPAEIRRNPDVIAAYLGTEHATLEDEDLVPVGRYATASLAADEQVVR